MTGNGHQQSRISAIDPPQDLTAEAAAIACMLLNPETAIPVVESETSGPMAFIGAHHRDIVTALLQMHAEGVPIDLVTVRNRLERIGILRDGCDGYLSVRDLADLAESAPNPASAQYYARIVREKHDARRILAQAQQLYQAAAAGDTNGISDALAALEHARPAAKAAPASFRTFREMLSEFPHLRPPVIHGLLRHGETMNVIAPQKLGKSWLVIDLALAVATGRPWLDSYMTERGDVLVIDNELHGETLANRIPRVADARGITLDEYADRLHAETLRGRLMDLNGLPDYFANVQPGRFKIVILDALYRFWPKDTDENDNGSVASAYNLLDGIAGRIGCSFVLIHHASKGSQSAKAVTDVGSGAGAQSRATDTHLILRHHEEPGAVVLDAAVRSWAPIAPVCLRWEYPVWTPAPELDPALLRPERPKRPKAEKPEAAAPRADEVAEFVGRFITAEPRAKSEIVGAAEDAGLRERTALKLLGRAEGRNLIHRWVFAKRRTVYFSTTPQPGMDLGGGSK